MKSRMQNSAPGEYSGVVDCGSRLIKAEGVGALWKGFLPAYIKHRPRRGNWPSTRVEETIT